MAMVLVAKSGSKSMAGRTLRPGGPPGKLDQATERSGTTRRKSHDSIGARRAPSLGSCFRALMIEYLQVDSA